ncbi:unnamed protein product, partial [Porites lobata]
RDVIRDGCFSLICLQDQVEWNQNEVFPDNFMRREVQAFVVSCTFKDEGCQWKGKVRHLEAHTSNCEFMKIPCDHFECGMFVKKADLPQHLETECKCRPETCGFCKKQIRLDKMKLHHEKECPAYPVVCEKCNKDGIPRAKLSAHQNLVVGDCDGNQIGRSNTEVKAKMEIQSAKETEGVQEQLREYCEGVTSLNRKKGSGNSSAASPSTADYEAIITHLRSQIEISEEEIQSLREQLREHGERIASLGRQVALGNSSGVCSSAQVSGDSAGSVPNSEIARRGRNLENRTADLEALSAGNEREIEATNSRVDYIERTLADRSVTLANLEEKLMQLEFPSYDGQLLWKITEFARRRNEAVSGQNVFFYSPPFYTSRYGYKMCARIYLNGDGMGLGTHISVFFVVMRGQNDVTLRWPFRQMVTFMLLDQDNVEHVIDTLTPDPNSSSFQRPRRETNIASGCPTFCSLTELTNHAYVRDDAMFLKIIVDTTDL